MNRNKTRPGHLLRGRGFTRIIPPFVFAIFYLCGTILAAPTTYAAGVPGGNVANPVVRAVDVAKPAVVRIITTLKARLTVLNLTTTSVTFPLSGSAYKMDLSGSGAFISAHGDILTADHVVQPPQDISDQVLYQTAAQDIADFYNRLHPDQLITAATVFAALSDGSLKSQSQYDQPNIRVYLSTDFTGPNSATSIDAVSPDTYTDVGSNGVLKTTDFQHGDTAIIHISKEDTPSIKLGDSTNVEPQDQLTIIGFPGNGDVPGNDTVTNKPDPSTGFFTPSVNQMYVSAIKQSAGKAPLIQVGGNVEHGDSGGPALDSNGNVVGVVSFGGADMPDGTSFLQASSIAQTLIDALQLDTTPGPFQTAWNEAFTQYSSTQAGHWHLAQQDMQKLQSTYPNFHAIDPFLAYATTQASTESPINLNTNIPLLIAVFLILVVIFVLVLLLFLARRKKNQQAALATQSSQYQPSHNGFGTRPESLESANSGSMGRIADQNIGAFPGTQLAQPRPMQSGQQVPQTPAAAYNAAQSGSLPVVPNQPPVSPWPQPLGAPASGQPISYGQPPYNPAQPVRPVQGPVQGSPYQSYPPQQGQYSPYSQASATQWPPVPGNMPYAPQNPAQQEALPQRRQPYPPSGTPYGQPPQGYGAMPTPTQTGPMPRQSQQLPAHLIPDASTASQEQTVRVNQRSTSGPEKIAESAGEKKNTASSMPALSKDQTEIATLRSEQDATKGFGEF